MKKSNKALASLLAMTGLASLTLTGCGSSKQSDPTVLNVICLNEGYGKEWIEEAVRLWEKKNPGYTVNLNATSDASSIIESDLSKKGNTDDVYISVSSKWKRYAGGGRFLALDDLLDEQVDGMALKDKINDEYKNSIYFKTQTGETHTYRLPWTSGIGGIMYNAKMFEENHWQVPTTYDELVALCKTIIDARIPSDPSDPTSAYVYPFAYTGSNTDYFDYTTFTWWSQLVGTEAINSFKNYTKDSLSNFAYVSNKTYAGLEKATEMWNNLFNNPNLKISDPEDISRDNHTSQKNFMNGKAAMMFNGDWVYNEMLNYSTTKTLPSNFELKIMKTPKATDALEEDASYIIGEDQYIAIPATTSKPDLAKDFIKTLVSDDVLKIFHNEAHGLMAYRLSKGSYDTQDSFMKSLADYRSEAEGHTFTNYSSSLLFLNGFVDFWGEPSAGRPFESLLKKTVKDVPTAFQNNYDSLTRQWSSWTSQSGM